MSSQRAIFNKVGLSFDPHKRQKFFKIFLLNLHPINLQIFLIIVMINYDIKHTYDFEKLNNNKDKKI